MAKFARRMESVQKSFIREILKVTASPEIISFAGGLPNPATFPTLAIGRATEAVLSGEGKAALQYSTTEGYPPLREYIARRYAAKGVRVNPENILITSGSQQGLDLVAKVLLDEGDRVVIESPGYLGAIQALSMFQPRLVPIAMEQDGIDTEQLAEALDSVNPKLFYSVTNFQNPSGITYSAEKRRRVAELMRRRDTVLVEDDPYGELRFMGDDMPHMGALMDGNMVMLGSFSKIFSPGMRLGWVCAPGDIMERLITAKQACDLHTNSFSQRVLLRYLRDNDIDAHIAGIRSLYRAQRGVMVDAIERHFPAGTEFTKPEGGMFLWVTLPGGLTALELFDRAIQRGVAFVPGDPFYVNRSNVPTMRLNYTNSDEADIERGIARLGEAIGEN